MGDMPPPCLIEGSELLNCVVIELDLRVFNFVPLPILAISKSQIVQLSFECPEELSPTLADLTAYLQSSHSDLSPAHVTRPQRPS